MTPPDLSASQIQVAEDCLAKWGGIYLGGQREPDSDATLRGKRVHAELEAWLLHAKMPTDRAALAALPHGPAPKTCSVERAIRFRTASTGWRGYIDVQAMLAGRMTTPVDEACGGADILIMDWKSTSLLANAKTAAELAEHPQPNLYAYEAFENLQADAVNGKWVYTATSGTAKALPVLLTFHRPKVYDVVGELDRKGARLQVLYQDRPDWRELEKNPGFCFAFRRQCHLYDQCKPAQGLTIAGADLVSNIPPVPDFMASMAAQFPIVPSAPPPVPSAPPPAPPLVPGFGVPLSVGGPAVPVLRSPVDINAAWDRIRPPPGVGVPERGFVNPPECPAIPAHSPEHAAALQGIVPAVLLAPTAPAAPPVAGTDELDALDRDQLKALAEASGAVPLTPSTRLRAAGLRDAIRQHRLGGPPAVPPPPPVPEAPTGAPLAPLHLEAEVLNSLDANHSSSVTDNETSVAVLADVSTTASSGAPEETSPESFDSECVTNFMELVDALLVRGSNPVSLSAFGITVTF